MWTHDTKHLRLSGEESNSYSLCVANMLPMDFETGNTGRIWKKKKRGKQYPSFSGLLEKWELFAFKCVSCKENWWICKTPILLIQWLRIQGETETYLYIDRRKDLRQIEHLWGQEKGMTWLCVVCRTSTVFGVRQPWKKCCDIWNISHPYGVVPTNLWFLHCGGFRAWH